MSENPPSTRWAELTGGASGPDYAARFEALAATGQDVNGEASFCAALLPPPARVLDAGCGTGRVALRLHSLGYDCVGVDVDESMLAVAAATTTAGSRPEWVLADLSTLDLDQHGIPCGFGVDSAQLPGSCPVTTLAAYDSACELAGMELSARHGTWQGTAFADTDGYAVSVHLRQASRQPS